MQPHQLEVTKTVSLTGHTGSVYCLLQDVVDPKYLYSAGGDGLVVQWNLHDTQKGQVLARVPTNIFSLLQIPEHNHFLLGQLQGGIHVLDVESHKEIRHLALHEKGVFDLKLHPSYEVILAAGGDGILSVWDKGTYGLSDQIPVSEASIRSITFSPDGTTIALGCSDHKIYLMNARNFVVEQVLTGHSNSVFCIAWSPDVKYLLSGSRDAQMMVWDVGKKYQLYRRIPAHLATINALAYNPSGNLIATASRDKDIRIWDAATFELLKVINHQKFEGHINSVNNLCWTDNQTLVTCSDDRNIIIWTIQVHDT